MKFWMWLQKRITRKRAGENGLDLTLLAGVLSSDRNPFCRRFVSSVPGSIDPAGAAITPSVIGKSKS